MKVDEAGENFVRYRFRDVSVIALRDGYVDMPPGRLRMAGNELAAQPANLRLVNGNIRLSVNAFLVIEEGSHLLIDTGASNAWEPSMGRLLDALAEAHVSRMSITDVALTHTHADHVNGLVAPDGSDAFPNATRIFVGHKETRTFADKPRLQRFKGNVVTVADGQSITERVTAFAAPGHSPAHTGYEIRAGDNRLLVWGDVVHVPSVQFADPDLTWELDANQSEAMATRRKLLDIAARPNTFVGGAHLEFPGVGYVHKEGVGFRFRGINQ